MKSMILTKLNNEILSNKDLEQKLFQMYLKEKREAKLRNIFPLHLYSKRVYRAYNNAWRLIDRKLLTQEEINIMLRLGIYKPSQKDISAQYLDKETRKELCKIRIGVC